MVVVYPSDFGWEGDTSQAGAAIPVTSVPLFSAVGGRVALPPPFTLLGIVIHAEFPIRFYLQKSCLFPTWDVTEVSRCSQRDDGTCELEHL